MFVLNCWHKSPIGCYILANCTKILIQIKKRKKQQLSEQKELILFFFFFPVKMLDRSYIFHTFMLKLYQNLLIDGCIEAKYIKIMDFLQFLKRAVPYSGAECTMIFFLWKCWKSLILLTLLCWIYTKSCSLGAILQQNIPKLHIFWISKKKKTSFQNSV